MSDFLKGVPPLWPKPDGTYGVTIREISDAEAACLDTTFRDCVESLEKCLARVGSELPFLENEARDKLADLCGVFRDEFYNARNG